MAQLPRRSKTHALVIGGSMAGMLAARVLANHFDSVTIIERDRLPDQAAPRKGTPQARHLHVLLERGRHILEHFFPGLSQELVSAGASLLDTAADFSILNPAGWAVQFRSGISLLTCSRDLLDCHVRRRLQADPRIRFEQSVDAMRLITNLDGTSVTGVAVRHREAPSVVAELDPSTPLSALLNANAESETIISADLVVEASGRGSRLPHWLDSLGFGRPEETIVNAHLGYATRLYRRPRNLRDSRQGLFVQAAPPNHPRAGVAVPIEGDRWIVTVSGGDGNHPPINDAGFLEFVRGLRSSAIYDAIKNCEPLSPVFGQRGLDNRVRHYERMKRWPDRLVVLGDAACAFNPVYAQGITTAALGALTLDECLRKQRRQCADGNMDRVASRFQKQLARVIKTPWLLATGEDRRYRKTEAGRCSILTRCTHRYMDEVFRLITHSRAVRERSLRVFHLMRHPVTLFHPGTVARVALSLAQELTSRLLQRLHESAEMLLGSERAWERSA